MFGMACKERDMSSFTLEQRKRIDFDDILAAEGSVWASLDSTYDRGLRAGQANALRDHLAVIVSAAQAHIARRPTDRAAVLTFVGSLQKVLVGEVDGPRKDPFEFDGGLGI